jgi:hypothetical protein
MPKGEIVSEVSPKKKGPNTARPQSQTKAFQDQQRYYGGVIDQRLPGAQNPMGNADPLSLLLAAMQNGHNGSNGGRSGGGGGSSAAAQAQAIADRNAALDQILQQQLGGIQQGYAGQNSALDQLLASQNSGFDQRGSSLQQLNQGANDRLTGIMGGLNQNAGQARQATQQAYSGGDQRLQALMHEYAQMAHGADTQQNQTLGAFSGAGGGQTGVVNPSGGGVQDMIMAGRTANTMRGNAADSMYANRQNVYGGLQADAQMQNGQQMDLLLGQLAQQRQQAQAAAQQQHAALALQQAQAEMQARLSNATSKAP